ANVLLFLFNMLPIYPLDGGQILQSLLWFVIGRARSLMAVSIIGIVTLLAIAGWAVFNYSLADLSQNWLLGLIAVFAVLRCVTGIQQARILAQLEAAPRHRDAACPSCSAHPLKGDFWKCADCGTSFDTFVHQAACPGCGRQFALTACPECRRSHPVDA